MILNYIEIIKYIVMKFEENERVSIIRFMKVKDMVFKKVFEEKKKNDLVV